MEKAEKRGLGVLNGLTELFRHSPPAAEPEKRTDNGFEALRQQFDTALDRLNAKIEERRQGVLIEQRGNGKAGVAEKARLEETIHREMREDIQTAHRQLATGLEPADIDGLRSYLQELDKIGAPGAESHDPLERARYSIFRRFHLEAGKIAWRELEDRMRERGVSWPELVKAHPFLSAEEIDQERRRRLDDKRLDFLNDGIHKSSEIIVGVVTAWKSDYPDRGTPLWQALALEGVATALRARWLKSFVEGLRQERAEVERKAAELLGGEIAAINDCLRQGCGSLVDAHRLVASSLKILDEVIPDIAWQQVRTAFPEAF